MKSGPNSLSKSGFFLSFSFATTTASIDKGKTNIEIIKLNKFRQIENKFIINKQFNYAFSVFYFNIKKNYFIAQKDRYILFHER